MNRIRIIACAAGMLLLVQVMYGQQEHLSAVDTSQVRIRMPIHALKADPSNQAKITGLSIPVEVFREDIRKDSFDLTVGAVALEHFRSEYSGLRVLKAPPELDSTDMAENLAEAMTFQKYPTYEQYDSMMHYFADTYPAICKIDTFGTSIEGRLLLTLKISDNVEQREDEPAFFLSSTMHGNELVGYVLSLRLADFLLSNYGSDVEVDRIVNDVELWINPLSNPDGTYYPDNNSTVRASRRGNVNGVDLNRNFPDPKRGDVNDPSGRQKETQAMMALMEQLRPNLSANIHSGAEVVNYPWDHQQDWHPDHDWFILISLEYADEARSVNPSYMMFADDSLGYIGITNGADWYVITGGRQDYVTYYLHGRELTLELSSAFRLESEYLEDHWNYNKWSLINLVTQSRYGIHGNVTDISGNPIRATVWVTEHDNDNSLVESDSVSGNFYRYLKEGVYDLVISSEGFHPVTLIGVEVFDYQKTALSVQLDSLRTSNRTYDQMSDQTTPLHVYPNPAHDLIRIKTPKAFSGGTEIILSDLSGRTVLRTTPPAGATDITMDLSGLQSGIYLLYRPGDPGSGTKIIIR